MKRHVVHGVSKAYRHIIFLLSFRVLFSSLYRPIVVPSLTYCTVVSFVAHVPPAFQTAHQCCRTKHSTDTSTTILERNWDDNRRQGTINGTGRQVFLCRTTNKKLPPKNIEGFNIEGFVVGHCLLVFGSDGQRTWRQAMPTCISSRRLHQTRGCGIFFAVLHEYTAGLIICGSMRLAQTLATCTWDAVAVSYVARQLWQILFVAWGRRQWHLAPGCV